MRKASDVVNDGFPYGYPGIVCYIELIDGDLRQITGRDEARAATLRAIDGDSTLYAAWPGTWRTDLFVIDDLHALGAAVKALPSGTSP